MTYRRPNVPPGALTDSLPFAPHGHGMPEYDAHVEFMMEVPEGWVDAMRATPWWQAARAHTIEVVEEEVPSLLDAPTYVRRTYLIVGDRPVDEVITRDEVARMVAWPHDATDNDRDAYRAWLAWQARDADRTRRAIDAGRYD